MEEVIKQSDVEIIRFDEKLLEKDFIITSREGINIFIANAHLSYKGSVILATEMDLLNQAVQLAR